MGIHTNPTYRLTNAGILAVRAERSVPGWYRTILTMMEGDTPSERICEILSAHTKKQVMVWLDQLETLGFISAVVEQAEPLIVADAFELDLLPPIHRQAA